MRKVFLYPEDGFTSVPGWYKEGIGWHTWRRPVLGAAQGEREGVRWAKAMEEAMGETMEAQR